MSRPVELPRWMEIGVLPLVNLMMALAVCSVVLALVGLAPQQVFAMLLRGAFGSAAGWSYTLFYATTFIFTGLAVAVAFHGGLFNIGGEGQAMIGGLGCSLVALFLGEHWPAAVLLPVIVLASILFGALYQGGAELAFELPGFSRDMVTTLQGLIVLFSGAMAYVAAPALGRLHRLVRPDHLPSAGLQPQGVQRYPQSGQRDG